MRALVIAAVCAAQRAPGGSLDAEEICRKVVGISGGDTATGLMPQK